MIFRRIAEAEYMTIYQAFFDLYDAVTFHIGKEKVGEYSSTFF